MVWRSSPWRLVLLASIVAAGCNASKQYPHGWVEFDVPAAAPPSGWSVYKDADSGVSIAIPPQWIQWNQNDTARVTAFFDLVKRKVPNVDPRDLRLNQQGILPNLLFMDTSPDSLRPMAFTNLMVVHMSAPGSADLDKIESGLKAQSTNPVQRVTLPIGPVLVQAHEASGRAASGKTITLRTTVYMFMRKNDLYVVRLTAPVDRYPTLQPIIDQVMKSVRLVKPVPAANTAPSAPPAMNGMGGPGMAPGSPGYGQQGNPYAGGTPTNPQGGPPPDAPPPVGYPGGYPQGTPPQGYPQGQPPQDWPPQGGQPPNGQPQGDPPQQVPPQGGPPQGDPSQGQPPNQTTGSNG
jgi:hypothetical protein